MKVCLFLNILVYWKVVIINFLTEETTQLDDTQLELELIRLLASNSSFYLLVWWL